MKKIKISSLILFLLICYNAVAQFSVTGELRPRFEYRNGYKQLRDSSTTTACFVSQRTRLYAYYKTNKLAARITFYDARIWGDEQLKSDIPGIGLYEGWAELLLFDSLSMRIGRQELSYNNNRLIATSSWSQKGGPSHDALLLKYKKGTWSADFGAAFNQLKEQTYGTDYFVQDNYKTLNFLWLTKNFNNFKLNVAGISDGFQKRNTHNTLYIRGTYGGIAEYKYSRFCFALRTFLQTGKDTAGTDINAYFFNMHISYKPTKKLTLLAGLEYISGNHATDTLNNEVNYFSTLYGSTHTFNGNLDYFTDIPKHTKLAGLDNGYIFLTYKLNDKILLKTDFHYFMLQNNYVYDSIIIDKYLGSEIDVSCKIDFSKEINLQFGYSVMFAEDAMEIITGGDKDLLPYWGWVMLTVKPEIFLQK
ncbi:MAG: alginate export family protein [Bacteroidia bacterium]|nr:alginate export family protein [Bacteroidia bacterium]